MGSSSIKRFRFEYEVASYAYRIVEAPTLEEAQQINDTLDEDGADDLDFKCFWDGSELINIEEIG